MKVFEKIVSHQEKISVIGLGYVGLPLALAFAKKADVIGFDISKEKINAYQNGIDPMNEVGSEAVRHSTALFTTQEEDLQQARFHIITVPTPIKMDKTPNLQSVEEASRMLARNLTKGSIVVYESTVYPGVTEDICIPLLEEGSGLVCGEDFWVGYSPERINPGDKINTLNKITKIVSGMDQATLHEIANVYEMIIEAGVHKAGSIKVAEAAKVVENSQRDINIAFMNELAMVFDRMDIDTSEVIEAMQTKWNALPFTPGLVGGHCIGVDPYYFIYEAERLGYHSQIILSGRKINDGMSRFITDTIIKQLIHADKNIKQANVVIFGAAFKENCADIRNSKVIDIVDQLKEFGVHPLVVDPFINTETAKIEYGIEMTDVSEIRDADCLIFAVGHDLFKTWTMDEIDHMYAPMDHHQKVMIDVKGIFDKEVIEERGYNFWRL